MSLHNCGRIAVVLLGLLMVNPAMAHQYDSTDTIGKLGQAESQKNDLVIVRELQGPSKTHGIESVKALGIVDLGAEFKGMSGYQMRARVFTIKPGGVVARHEHQSRPGDAYILSGEIVEHRNDAKEALVRKAGDLAIERSGVAHWWENTFDEPVVAFIVDIYLPQ